MNKPSKVREVAIWSEFITLGQLLKVIDYVSVGGDVKMVLADGGFTVNGEFESRRGRKLYPDDMVSLPQGGRVRVVAKN